MTIIWILGGTETIWHFCCVEAPQVMKRCTQPTFNLLLCQKSSACFDIKTSCRGLNEVNSPHRSGNGVRCHVSIQADPHALCREMFVHKVVVVTLILWDWGPWIQLIKMKWNVFLAATCKWMTVSLAPVTFSPGKSSTGRNHYIPGWSHLYSQSIRTLYKVYTFF